MLERCCQVSDDSTFGSGVPPAPVHEVDAGRELLKVPGLHLFRPASLLRVGGIAPGFLTLVVSLLTLMAAMSGYATPAVLVPLSLPELVDRSELIVIGEVILTQSGWDSTRTLISTRVDVQAEELLKGSVAGSHLSFILLGGQVGDIVSSVAGSPWFTRGERVLLFLSRRRDGTLGVTDLFQGKFSLERDVPSGREMAIRRVPGSGQVLDRAPLDQARAQILTSLGR